jgi:His-Xaa-Ser system protein HxsD
VLTLDASASSPSIWDAGGHAGLRLDPDIYTVDVALAAGYKFTDRVFVWLQSDPGSGGYIVFLRPKNPQDAANLSALAGEFANELLDQALRERLERQFGSVRTLIVAQAFAEGNLLDAVSTSDARTDPEGAGSRR